MKSSGIKKKNKKNLIPKIFHTYNNPLVRVGFLHTLVRLMFYVDLIRVEYDQEKYDNWGEGVSLSYRC